MMSRDNWITVHKLFTASLRPKITRTSSPDKKATQMLHPRKQRILNWESHHPCWCKDQRFALVNSEWLRPYRNTIQRKVRIRCYLRGSKRRSVLEWEPLSQKLVKQSKTQEKCWKTRRKRIISNRQSSTRILCIRISNSWKRNFSLLRICILANWTLRSGGAFITRNLTDCATCRRSSRLPC